MSLPDVIKAAMAEIQTIAKTETVIGEPIVAGNVTLIPVSRVSIGFAAGGGGNENKSGSGAGTGGGVSVTPMAFIAIIDGRVSVHSVTQEEQGFGKLLSLAPELIGKIAKFMGKKNHKDHKEPSAE